MSGSGALLSAVSFLMFIAMSVLPLGVLLLSVLLFEEEETRGADKSECVVNDTLIKNVKCAHWKKVSHCV